MKMRLGMAAAAVVVAAGTVGGVGFAAQGGAGGPAGPGGPDGNRTTTIVNTQTTTPRNSGGNGQAVRCDRLKATITKLQARERAARTPQARQAIADQVTQLQAEYAREC